MKKILLLVVALVITVPGIAQSDDGETEIITKKTKTKSNVIFLGPKIGATITSMTQPEEGNLYDGSGFGFSGGLSSKIRFGRASENSSAGTGYFGVGLEVKYKMNSVKTVGTNESGSENANLSVGYFEVPVFAQFYPIPKSSGFNSLYVEAGVAFAGTISRSPESLTLFNPSADVSQVTYYTDVEGSKLKGGDIRPLIGLGYTIPRTGLDINARYYIGTSKLADNFSCKMNTFEFSLAWMFKLGKF